jgi:hypothetical protein
MMDGTTLGVAMVSAIALILPVMALSGRKIPAARLASMAAIWVVVFGLAWLIMRVIGY